MRVRIYAAAARATSGSKVPRGGSKVLSKAPWGGSKVLSKVPWGGQPAEEPPGPPAPAYVVHRTRGGGGVLNRPTPSRRRRLNFLRAFSVKRLEDLIFSTHSPRKDLKT